jgi:hypothetical protein
MPRRKPKLPTFAKTLGRRLAGDQCHQNFPKSDSWFPLGFK